MKIALLLPALLLGVGMIARAQDVPKDSDIETVTVTGQKATITRSIEGTYHDETGNPVAKAGTAADVLNTVPSVNVSPGGDVTLRGNGNVQIYVNGKPSAMLSGADRGLTLQSMTGDDIAGIEVITNPSAKYGADGSSIINIVLKKDRKPGADATLTANYGEMGRKNAALNANLTRGALSLHAAASFREDMRPIQKATSTIDTDPLAGTSSGNTQNLSSDSQRHSYSLSAGADYDMSAIDTLSAELAWKENNADNTIDEFNRDFDSTDTLTSDFDRRSTGPRQHIDTSERLDFTHKTSDGGQWDLTIANSEAIDNLDKSYRDIFTFPTMPDQIVRVLTDADRRLTQVTGNGVIATGPHDQLSFGFDLRLIDDDFVNLNAAIDPVGGMQTVNPALTNQSDIVRRLGALYATYQAGFGRLTVLGGLRFETARTSIGQDGVGPAIVHNDSNFNPTLHMNFWIDDDHAITANFSRTSQRPDTAALDPFATYIDSQNEASGNPDLKLQTVLSGEVGYESDHDGMDQTFTAYLRQSSHTVTDFSSFIANDILLTSKRNGGNGRSAGLEYELDGSLTPDFKYELSGNLFYAELRALDLAGTLFNSRISYSAKASLDYAPTERDQIRLDANFAGETITAQGTQSGTAIIDALWQHRIRPGLFAVLRLNDITNGSKLIGITRTDTVFRTDDTFIRGRQIYVGMQYKF